MTLASPATTIAQTDTAQDSFATSLLTSGHLTPSSLERARRAAADSGIGLPTAVVNLGIVPETTVAETLSTTLSLPLVEADEWPDEAVGEASPRWMEQSRLLPLRID